ncbi:hypothetical protein BpHYR1_038737 [Brachionus plicatilis]|uniref:Uncharacterized protein n=1 Tax=Brachionus plicatilis TaxID=10195 RepID=A0A3M7SNX3_BRAPC|nr:hypothetical protein BpHYR1_038737 [Brachionus plicatilis]
MQLSATFKVASNIKICKICRVLQKLNFNIIERKTKRTLIIERKRQNTFVIVLCHGGRVKVYQNEHFKRENLKIFRQLIRRAKDRIVGNSNRHSALATSKDEHFHDALTDSHTWYV